MRSMPAFVSFSPVAYRRAAALLGVTTALLGAPTQVRAADSFSFVQLNDTQIDGSDTSAVHTSKLREELRAFAGMNDKPAFILDTGSVTERGTAAQFAAFRQIVSGDLPKSMPLYAVPGSGDVRWSLPAADAFQQESGQPRYRSFDHGGVHFILLDSTVPLETLGHLDPSQMAWLQGDLAKIDKKRPLIVCFHHTAGQQPAAIDNQDDLFQMLSGYNMRLYLCGQGQEPAMGNINGVPVVTVGSSFSGAYNLIKVSKNKLEVYQRILGESQPAQPLLSESLRWSGSPPITARVQADNGHLLNVTVDRSNLPKDARVSCCLDRGKPVEMIAPAVPDARVGWAVNLPLSGVASGDHRVLVLVAYKDKDNANIENVYRLSLPVRLLGTASIKPNWSVDLKSPIQGDALSDDDQVYIPTMSGTLFALDAKTGDTRWQYQTGGSLYGTPARDGETLYFGSCDGNINAVDRKTGGPLWKAALGAPILAGTTVVGKVVCVPVTNGSVVGLDSASGRELWRTRDDGGMYRSRAATDGAHLFVGDGTGHLHCLDAVTGQEVWNVAVAGEGANAAIVASPTLDSLKTLVYVSSLGGSLHALSAKTGAEKWKVESLGLGYSRPALSSSGFLYSASRTDDGQVYAFNHLTGEQIWSSATGSPIYDASCCSIETNVCIGSVDGTFSTLYGSKGAALGKSGGDVNWQYHLPMGHLLASPITDETSVNKQVYIGNLSGVFAAFPASNPTPATP